MSNNRYNQVIKAVKWFYLFTFLPLYLSSCVDFSDTTPPVSATIQLVRPDAFVNMTDLSGLTVTLQSDEGLVTAVTDTSGKAILSDLAPGTYDVSTSATVSHSQYEQYTGEIVGGQIDFIMTGTLNKQALSADASINVQLMVYPKETLIISKVYPSNSKIDGGSYSSGKYIELYNNSEDSVDAAGLYIGLLESESTIAYQVYPYDKAVTPDSIYLKQVFRIPDGQPVMVAPGASLLLVNSATDHSGQNEYERDLRDADFEAKDITGKIPNNADVTALELVYTTYSSISCMNLAQGAPVSLVIFRTTEDVKEWLTVYAYGKTRGNRFMRMHIDAVLDGVDIVKNKAQTGADINSKRLPQSIDASYGCFSTAAGNIGERLVRKTLSATTDGRKILQDTNNSLNDFICNDNINPREYLEP
jgi:hypothetical protein